MKLEYRPDIDGLRAVAVLAVIFYHAEFALAGGKFLPGGFLGVDVFFVISGYLITSILRGDLLARGGIEFRDFYERRARRLLPALLLAILASIPAAWLLLYPEQLKDFALSIPASILFASNFYWYFSLQEYGAESALLKPLLHTWSLAVEEQFYLVYPALLIAIHRRARAAIVPVLVAISVFSFMLAIWLSSRDPSFAFYFLPARAWELAAGGLLAFVHIDRQALAQHPAIRYLPSVGLALILVSLWRTHFGPGHPGYATVLPVAGTLLIIAFANKRDPASRLLAQRACVFIGLVSYSLYIWHYPIFAFGRHLDPAPTTWHKLVWLALTLAASVLSYYLVEKPCRNRQRVPLRLLASGAGLCLVVTSAFTVATLQGDGFGQRFDRLAALYGNNDFDNQRLRRLSWQPLVDDAVRAGFPGTAEGRALYEQQRLWFAGAPGKDKVLIVGNSHGKDLYNAIRFNPELFDDIELAFYHMQIGAGPQVVQDLMASPNFQAADTIVLSSRFTDQRAAYGLDGRRRGDLEALPDLIPRFRAAGKRVLLTSRIPEFRDIDNQPVFDWFVTHAGNSNEADEEELKRLFYEQRDVERYAESNRQLRDIAEQYQVPYLDRVALLCDDQRRECDGVTPEGYKMLFDYGHTTLEGAKLLGKKIHGLNWLQRPQK